MLRQKGSGVRLAAKKKKDVESPPKKAFLLPAKRGGKNPKAIGHFCSTYPISTSGLTSVILNRIAAWIISAACLPTALAIFCLIWS